MITSRSLLLVAMVIASGSAMAQPSGASGGVGAAGATGIGTHAPGATGPGNGSGINSNTVRPSNPALRQKRVDDASSTSPDTNTETGDTLQQQRQQSGERMVKERKGQVQDAN